MTSLHCNNGTPKRKAPRTQRTAKAMTGLSTWNRSALPGELEISSSEWSTASAQESGSVDENERSHGIIGAAIAVHRELGPGLLESIYEEALVLEPQERGHSVARQAEVALSYKGKRLQNVLRLDLAG